MNNNYKNKKRVAVIILSVLAVCLAAGLVWYVGTMGKAELPIVEPEEPEPETVVTVPEIDAGGAADSEEAPEPALGTEPAAEQEAEQQEEAQPEAEEAPEEGNRGEEAGTISEGTEPVRTDGRPQSPKDAVHRRNRLRRKTGLQRWRIRTGTATASQSMYGPRKGSPRAGTPIRRGRSMCLGSAT